MSQAAGRCDRSQSDLCEAQGSSRGCEFLDIGCGFGDVSDAGRRVGRLNDDPSSALIAMRKSLLLAKKSGVS